MKFITTLLLCLFSGIVMAQTNNTPSYEEMLVGVWRFKEMRNQENEKITHYMRGSMKVLVTGPTITLNPDMSYKKSFIPGKYDSGFWKFDSTSMQIYYKLFIDSTTFVGKDLIKKGLAVKHPDGKYYEDVVDRVYSISPDELILINGLNREIYRKGE
jgi:hypothetical protein